MGLLRPPCRPPARPTTTTSCAFCRPGSGGDTRPRTRLCIARAWTARTSAPFRWMGRGCFRIGISEGIDMHRAIRAVLIFWAMLLPLHAADVYGASDYDITPAGARTVYAGRDAMLFFRVAYFPGART